MILIYDKNTNKNNYCLITRIFDSVNSALPFELENSIEVSTLPVLPTHNIFEQDIILEYNIVTKELRYSIIPKATKPPSPMDMLGIVTTQNSIELSELKQQVEAIGQGVVEIMLNQQMGGM